MVQGCCWGGHKGKHTGKVSVVSLLSGKLCYLLVTAGTSQGGCISASSLCKKLEPVNVCMQLRQTYQHLFLCAGFTQ